MRWQPHAVHNNSSFDATIAHAINLLGDADSTGSIAGQIAGALYGVEAIPAAWLAHLEPWDGGSPDLAGDIMLRAWLLHHRHDDALLGRCLSSVCEPDERFRDGGTAAEVRAAIATCDFTIGQHVVKVD